ncbi:unnamed protein product [Bemisia tabaci]|uniref:SH3 domain-binding protein 5 n=1 Tax=Bemisia tabaci TaxID=7038 RepID=A0A9P0AKC6_BEMTA|nr:unnamed protein product [Bemisia tabaci]
MACYDVAQQSAESECEAELDPRIRIELERLNNATDKINKLEVELDEANTTFRLLMGESTRRLKLLARKLGSCIEKARPYYDAIEIARQAQQECQRAAERFQRANELHQEAKLTVAHAEQRFMSKQNEWEFDNAWQEKLNNAIIKVTDAELMKTESEREHRKKASLFHAAEQKAQLFEQKLKSNIAKSRPYFDEKMICERQLSNQKQRILELRKAVTEAKQEYADSLRRLEDISEEIHMKRRMKLGNVSPCGVREPGVGAEVNDDRASDDMAACSAFAYNGYFQTIDNAYNCDNMNDYTVPYSSSNNSISRNSLDYETELDKCDKRSLASVSATTSSAVSEIDETEWASYREDLEMLKQRVKELEAMPNEERGSIEGEAVDSSDKDAEGANQKMNKLSLSETSNANPTDQAPNQNNSIIIKSEEVARLVN